MPSSFCFLVPYSSPKFLEIYLGVEIGVVGTLNVWDVLQGQTDWFVERLLVLKRSRGGDECILSDRLNCSKIFRLEIVSIPFRIPSENVSS